MEGQRFRLRLGSSNADYPGASFRNGVAGPVTRAVANRFKAVFGRKVTIEPWDAPEPEMVPIEIVAEEPETEAVDLSKLTKREVADRLIALGVDVHPAATKAKLVELLEQAEQESPEGDLDRGD